MNVTFVIGSLGYGGKERQLSYLIQHLPSNVQIQLIVLSEDIKYTELKNHVDDLIVVPKKRKYKLKTLFDLYTRVLDFSPTYIHSWDTVSPILFKPLVIFTKIKLINGSLRTSGPQLKLLKARLYARFLISISDVSIANSYACLKTLRMESMKKLQCIHNGFSLEEFISGVKPRSNSPDKNKLRICMVGRFYESKDYKLFIDAVNLLIKNNTDFEVICIGNGPMIDQIKTRVRDYGLTNVNFLGNRKDIPAILSTCDIGVLLNPSNRAEGISNAIMEYMASGLPVVATNAGGTPELVKHGKTGFLVESGDINQVQKYLLELMDNQLLRKEMGLEARKVIENDFSIKRMIDNYLNLYRGLK